MSLASYQKYSWFKNTQKNVASPKVDIKVSEACGQIIFIAFLACRKVSQPKVTF